MLTGSWIGKGVTGVPEMVDVPRIPRSDLASYTTEPNPELACLNDDMSVYTLFYLERI